MHSNLVISAVKAIQKVHSDTSVDVAQTRDSLLELKEEIEFLLAAIEEDIKLE